MSCDYLNITSSKTHPISSCTPLCNILCDYSIEDGINLIINHQVERPSPSRGSAPEIDHWWQRKWQVSLDFYLSSQVQGNRIEHPLPLMPSEVEIPLPDENEAEKSSPIEALMDRKTHRKFRNQSLNLRIFSELLKELSGELLPDIWRYYMVVFDVQDIPSGIYEYHPQKHGLVTVREGLFRCEAVELLCGMSASLSASFVLLFSIDVAHAQACYPYDRALREIYIDSGRLAQKVIVKGMQHSVGGLPSPAMRDTLMCDFLNIDPKDHIPFYSLAMGLIPEGNLQ